MYEKGDFRKNKVDHNPPSSHDFSAFFMLENSPRCVFLGGKKSLTPLKLEPTLQSRIAHLE